MIPNPRKKRQREPGEGAFPLERAKQIWNSFDETGQDMTFQQFYHELCGIADPDKMRKDLAEIGRREGQARDTRALIERGLLRGNN